jgi:hypothetical protein
VLVLHRNPDPLVLDNENYFALFHIKIHVNHNLSIKRILNGVLDYIEGYLLKPVWVPNEELWQLSIFLHVHYVGKQRVIISILVRNYHTVKQLVVGFDVDKFLALFKNCFEAKAYSFILGLNIHQFLNFLQLILKVECNISPDELSTYNRLPVVHVVKFKDHILEQDHHSIELVCKIFVLELALLNDF